MVEEVAVAGGSFGRNHGDSLHHFGPLQLAVHLQHALFLQPVDNLHTAAHKVAEGVFRVDLQHHKRQAEHRVHRGRYFQHHFQTRGKLLAGGLIEAPRQRTVDIGPAATADAGNLAAGLILLEQLHIAMAAAGVDILQFGRYPDILCFGRLHEVGDAAGEFKK